MVIKQIKILFPLAFLIAFSFNSMFAQVGIGTNSPNTSAVLELQSTSQGFLLPRLNTTQQKNIEEPAQGLIVYNLDSNDIYFFTGVAWLALTDGLDTIHPWECGDSLIDHRDDQIYGTVQIGAQCWLKENLNIGIRIDGFQDQTENSVIEKYCYDDQESICDTYGGLYQWDEMMQYITSGGQGICPTGWHLPSDEEWKILEGTVDSQYGVGDPLWDNTGFRGYDAGKNLKSTYGWNGGDGVDLYGFTSLPGGFCYDIGAFDDLGDSGLWWSSTEYDGAGGVRAWCRGLVFDHDDMYRNGAPKTYGYSVRCLKDE